MLSTLHRGDAGPATAAREEFRRDVVAGLSKRQKSLPCRYFYDDRGSVLFEQITELPEYYPTRTEAAILKASAAEMVADFPAGAVLVEFGSGSSRKTELLLRQLPGLRAYVMIDVSAGALEDARQRLGQTFPRLDVRPVVADFSYPVALAPDLQGAPKIGLFPGSTIGNLGQPEAQRLLRLFRAVLSPGGRLIVGVDLKKDTGLLHAAYNDAAGVTAAFNLNLLARINRELEADFDLAAFAHNAPYNARDGRIEMHLVSRKRQSVRVGGCTFAFAEGESIHTENSYKYSIAQFRSLAVSSGWTPRQVWTDPGQLFSVHELVSA
ncbi:MAG: L-histidine N(alpha)-methyltransferase [Hyphomicrobiales bacterium]|nr:MAG: L-histidine N(alpha)-methyltransferase [Hyphomicrobiales bacterium]